MQTQRRVKDKIKRWRVRREERNRHAAKQIQRRGDVLGYF